jgi:CubicO group peptidase (beta-lactamase class C family)
VLKLSLNIYISAAFFVSVIPAFLHAQTASDKVDKYIGITLAREHVPGLSLAVVHNGVPIKVKGYGFANVELKVPVSPETVFQSSSLGKMFTATAIMKLMEDGKLNLDDKITNYFSKAPANWQNITIRHLLTHTSGIPEYDREENKFINYQTNYTEDELLKIAMAQPLDFLPGEKWSYSDTGYIILGILIHLITGRYYGDMLQERVFTPLSMETARIINESEIVPNRAAGYELQKGEWVNQAWVAPSLNTTADGSLYITTLDLIKWDAAISSEKILKHSSLISMLTPVHLNNDSTFPYGFGWFLDPMNGHRVNWHSGYWQGFHTYFGRFLDDSLTIIILTNLSRCVPEIIAQDIAGIYVSELARPVYAVIPDENVALKNLVKNLYQNPESFNEKNQMLTPEFTMKLPLLKKRNIWRHNTFGDFQSVERLQNKNQEDPIVYRYRVKYKALSLLVLVTLNKAGKVIDITSERE